MNKNDLALDMFGKPFDQLTEEEKEEIEELINLKKGSELKKEI